jgi:uncharacterized PurR-regulated membrane protein YhhQ (DUF165 family)
VNSVLFVIMAFAGALSVTVLINMILIQILFKFIDSFFELGFLYGLRSLKDRGVLNRPAEPDLAPALAATAPGRPS